MTMEEEMISNKRSADHLDQDTDSLETQRKIKREKLDTETYEAIVTVNTKGRCSFDMIPDTDCKVPGEEDSTKVRVECKKVLSAYRHLEPSCTQPSKYDTISTVTEGKQHEVTGSESGQSEHLTASELEQSRAPVINTSDCQKKPVRTGNKQQLKYVSCLPDRSEYVALDCEFVGVKKYTENGMKLDVSALGRCSIVNYDGKVICDIYARPKQPITNYRTKYSGIRKSHMNSAIPQDRALHQIANIIKDKIVVGHALKNDFSVLGIYHPEEKRRDTSLYPPFIQKYANGGAVGLKTLAKYILGKTIQKKSHCSVIDAQTTMEVFKTAHEEWESYILSGNVPIIRELNKSSCSPNNYCTGLGCKYACPAYKSNMSPDKDRHYNSYSGHKTKLLNGNRRQFNMCPYSGAPNGERYWDSSSEKYWNLSQHQNDYFEDKFWPDC